MNSVSQYVGLTTSVLDRVVKPRISRVTIPITYDCNQKCKTCGVWKLNKGSDSKKKDELTLQEFNNFCEANDMLWIALTGGEPFLRKDMQDILRIALSNSSFVSVSTNGCVTDKIVEDISEALNFPRSKATLTLSVSFNGPEETHNEIAGVKDSYKRAFETYTRLGKLNHKRLRTNISYVSSCFNEGKFKDFAAGLNGNFPGVKGVTYLVAQDSPSYFRTDWSVVIPPEKSEILELIKEYLPTYKIRGPFDYIGKKYLQGWITGKRVGCVAGTYNLMLDPYWNAYPCMFFCPTEKIGNLREVGFNLKNLDFERCKKLVSGCSNPCWTPCETFPTMLFRPWRCL